jgi:hypothetical protein
LDAGPRRSQWLLRGPAFRCRDNLAKRSSAGPGTIYIPNPQVTPQTTNDAAMQANPAIQNGAGLAAEQQRERGMGGGAGLWSHASSFDPTAPATAAANTTSRRSDGRTSPIRLRSAK